MMAGRHSIVTTSGAMAVLRGGSDDGVFDDATFFALPLVREFGGFPSGYAAIHYGEDETESRLAGLPVDPRDPRVVLAELRDAIQMRRYVIRFGGELLGRAGTKAGAETLLRWCVRDWRAGAMLPTQASGATRRGNGYTAVRIDAKRDGRSWATGALDVAWQLRKRGESVGIIKVEDDGLRAADGRD